MSSNTTGVYRLAPNLRENFIERAQQECGVRVIIEETCVHLDITQPKK